MEAIKSVDDITYREITYANDHMPLSNKLFISCIENLSGKLRIIKVIKNWLNDDNLDQNRWKSVLDHADISVSVDPSTLSKIPQKGPTIVVANHPHGLFDGFVLSYLTSSRRDDYRLMVRAFLANLSFMEEYLIPIKFPYEDNSARKNVHARNQALEYLKNGGCLCLFPSGGVATSDTMMGPPVEADWTPFLGKMVIETKATVVPVFFDGENSRFFQIANKISPLFRQSLLLNEVVKTMGKTFSPIIGDPIKYEELSDFHHDRVKLSQRLKDLTLALKRS